MGVQIVDTGISRSFPEVDALLSQAPTADEIIVILGTGAGHALAEIENPASKTAILIELGNECLGVYTGESRGDEGSNILGFARFRLGEGAPSNLIELVRQPRSDPAAIEAATSMFAAANFAVATCYDFAGRIIDRLVRPYYNAALRRLDEGLARADDLDTTLRLGLGYPEGPIALLERTGLAAHFEVTQALFEAYGEAAYAPARRACVAKQREKGKS